MIMKMADMAVPALAEEVLVPISPEATIHVEDIVAVSENLPSPEEE